MMGSERDSHGCEETAADRPQQDHPPERCVLLQGLEGRTELWCVRPSRDCCAGIVFVGCETSGTALLTVDPVEAASMCTAAPTAKAPTRWASTGHPQSGARHPPELVLCSLCECGALHHLGVSKATVTSLSSTGASENTVTIPGKLNEVLVAN